jgi:nucleoside-diphosphate-sugar epimerase
MRVLVAGATGAIGRPLISALVASHREVIGITSTERGVQTLRGKSTEAFEEARLQFVALRKFEARREKRKCK